MQQSALPFPFLVIFPSHFWHGVIRLFTIPFSLLPLFGIEDVLFVFIIFLPLHVHDCIQMHAHVHMKSRIVLVESIYDSIYHFTWKRRRGREEIPEKYVQPCASLQNQPQSFPFKTFHWKKKIKIRCNEQSNKYNGTAHGAMTLLLHKKTLIFGCLFSSQTGTKSKYLNFLEGNISV